MASASWLSTMLILAAGSAAARTSTRRDAGPPEEEVLVGRELDELAGHAAHPAIGPVPTGLRHEGRLSQLVRRNPLEQMGGQRRDMPHRIVELLGVWVRKAEHDAAVAFRGHRDDVPQQSGEVRGDGGVARAREGEEHVAWRSRVPHPATSPADRGRMRASPSRAASSSWRGGGTNPLSPEVMSSGPRLASRRKRWSAISMLARPPPDPSISVGIGSGGLVAGDDDDASNGLGGLCVQRPERRQGLHSEPGGGASAPVTRRRPMSTRRSGTAARAAPRRSRCRPAGRRCATRRASGARRRSVTASITSSSSSGRRSIGVRARRRSAGAESAGDRADDAPDRRPAGSSRAAAARLPAGAARCPRLFARRP